MVMSNETKHEYKLSQPDNDEDNYATKQEESGAEGVWLRRLGVKE
jgi:hypothetical protein